jgi:hypothetical protein
MHFFRFFPVAVIAAAMGIVACGDSGSNADIESCKVTSQDPFTIETVQQGITIVTTFELKNGKVVQTMDAGIDIPEQSCEEYRKDNDYGEVTCSGHKLIATSREDFTESRFNSLKQSYTSECNALN